MYAVPNTVPDTFSNSLVSLGHSCAATLQNQIEGVTVPFMGSWASLQSITQQRQDPSMLTGVAPAHLLKHMEAVAKGVTRLSSCPPEFDGVLAAVGEERDQGSGFRQAQISLEDT